MSSIERLTIQERRGKRKTNFVHDEKNSLRETLMGRANKLKDKIAEETNNFDFSVQKVMNQTLRQVQKHKQDFVQQHQHLQLIYKGEQYENRKQLLKEELHKKLQTCKNRYKQKITIIKDKKKRYYTSSGKVSQEKISIEDMLRTAKNKFKFQRIEKKKARNKSEIIHLKKVNQQEIINFVQKKYPTQSSLTFQPNKKQHDYQQISIDMIKAKGVRNLQLCDSIGNQFTPNKLHSTEIISLPSYSSKKALIESFKNKNRLLPNDHLRNHQRQNSNVEILSNSERSIFIPLGKVAISNERKRMCTEFQVTNSYKKEPQLANKRSSQIVDEFVQIQISEKNSKQKVRVFLPLNKKLKTEGSVKIRSKNLKTQGLVPLKTSRFDDYIQPGQMNLVKSLEFDKLSPPNQNYLQMSDKNKNEEEERNAQCMISINELFVQGEKQGKQMKRIGQNLGLKSILYNKKVNQLSRKMMRNQLNSRAHHRKLLTSQYFPLQEATSKSMLLDIKGSPMQLQQSLKVQKAKKRDSIGRR